MSKKKQTWKIGDLFLVPTLDGKLALGQVVGQEQWVLNSVSVVLFARRVDSPQGVAFDQCTGVDDAIAILFVTRDSLDRGEWPVVGPHPITIPHTHLPYEHLRSRRFVGAKVIGTGIVKDFLNAYFGLAPWNMMKDPNYFDGLLLAPDRKPSSLVFKGD